jgi:hypothetical protein
LQKHLSIDFQSTRHDHAAFLHVGDLPYR